MPSTFGIMYTLDSWAWYLNTSTITCILRGKYRDLVILYYHYTNYLKEQENIKCDGTCKEVFYSNVYILPILHKKKSHFKTFWPLWNGIYCFVFLLYASNTNGKSTNKEYLIINEQWSSNCSFLIPKISNQRNNMKNTIKANAKKFVVWRLKVM